MISMIIKNKKFFNCINYENLGQNCFYIATFFLGSALPISIVFYLISIAIFLMIKKVSFVRDKYNQILILSSGLIIFSSLNATLNLSKIYNHKILDIWINLFNWIPLFLLFFSSNIYLNNFSKRQSFSKFLIAGTIPVLISCILQAWFGVNGPLKIFNGLIVWYLDKVDQSDIAIAGLFSNRNYAAIWLSCVLGFSIYELLTINKNLYNKILIIIINFLIIYFTIYTFSRNALIGSIITLLIIFNKFRIALPAFFVYTTINLFIYFFPNTLIYSPVNINRFFIYNLTNFLNFNRIDVYSITSKLILENPLLGWGASTFAKMYKIKGGLQSSQHTHNIFLELSYNFGLPLSILLIGFVLILLFKTFKSINKNFTRENKLLIDKCWFASSILICISHLFDITYYDGKISILIWILLAGLKCIIDENSKTFKNDKVIYNGS